MKQATFALAIVCAAGAASADTTQLDDHVYAIDEGVAITLNNAGSDDFLFNWSDDSGDFTDVADPTLRLAISPAHGRYRT
jgi:hypothetical protein